MSTTPSWPFRERDLSFKGVVGIPSESEGRHLALRALQLALHSTTLKPTQANAT